MANDVYQLIVGGNVARQQVENVLHFEQAVVADPDPQIRAQNCVEAFVANWQAAWVACLPLNYLLQGFKCKRINNGGGPTYVAIAVGGTAGTWASNANESVVSPVIVVPYSDGVRWHAGRVFLPGVGDSAIDDGVYDPVFITTVIALQTLMLAPSTSGGDSFEYAIWSPKNHVSYIPHTMHLSLKPGVQRRRLVPTF